jgi:poly-gamma-glutamate capsule biosynthesis protein CapA/YwtB (metallophosphatase superfamily)
LAALALNAAPQVEPGGRPALRPVAQAAAGSGEVTLSAVGDTILGNTPTLPAHPRHYFADVRRAIRHGEQVVFANLEGTLTTQTDSKCGPSSSNCYAFRNPPAYAHVFADVGFTVLNNANNHSHDFGAAGLRQTRNAIEGAGLTHTGLPGEIDYVHAGGVRVAIVGFAPYSSTADMLDLDAAADLVRRAHRHAAVVVVYMHAGAEGTNAQHVTGNEEYYVGEDRGNAKKFAHRVIRAGADLVIGSGPHVVRGMEFYRGHLVVYSLGNFANYHNFGSSGVLADSAILRARLGPHGGFRSARIVSVRLVDNGRPVRGGDTLSVMRQLSKQDFGSHAARLSKDGHIRPPA